MSTATAVDRQELAPLSLAELTAQALAADPDAPLAADAMPFEAETATTGGLLPSWYMPVPVTYQRRPWHRIAALAVIASFLLINALGLCITYGHLVVA
jgi:hypothetical protein